MDRKRETSGNRRVEDLQTATIVNVIAFIIYQKRKRKQWPEHATFKELHNALRDTDINLSEGLQTAIHKGLIIERRCLNDVVYEKAPQNRHDT